MFIKGLILFVLALANTNQKYYYISNINTNEKVRSGSNAAITVEALISSPAVTGLMVMVKLIVYVMMKVTGEGHDV